MNPNNNYEGILTTDSKLKRASRKVKPVIKRVAKSAAVVCTTLTAGSLGAVAKENLDKVNTATKAAKSAKSSSKRMKRVAEVGSALIVCANAGEGVVDQVVNNDGSKVFKIVLFGIVWFCGFMCRDLCE